MKKLAMVLAAVSLSAAMLAGCGKEDGKNSADNAQETAAAEESVEQEAFEDKVYPDEAYLDNLNVADFVEPGEYTGIEVTVEAPHVDEAEVESYVEKVRENNPVKTEVTGRAAEDGDLVDIDYEGKKDGEAFEGGSAENYELTLGSGSFISGFEDGVIGMQAGETKELELTFPDDYDNEELAGQDVVFTVTLNKIYTEELPEFNDAFVEGLGIEDVTTPEEYRQYIYDLLLQSDQRRFDSEAENAVITKVRENATFKADAAEMETRYYDRLLSSLNYQAQMYGFNMQTFMMLMYGMSEEEYLPQMEESSHEAAQQVLVLQAIAEKEGLTVSDEEMEAEMEESAAEYGYESVEEYKAAIGNEIKGYREMVMTEKVISFLMENATVHADAQGAETAETEGTAETGETAAESETE